MSFGIKSTQQRKNQYSLLNGETPSILHYKTATTLLCEPVTLIPPSLITQPMVQRPPNRIHQFPSRRIVLPAPPTKTGDEKLNTHYYDGKLKENSLIESVSDLQKVDAPELTAEKRELFTSLMDKLMAEKKTMAGYAVRAIIDGIRSPANFDPTNGIYADDILYLICKGDYPSEYFTEQLGDIITSGSCPQGRCARLFQILNSLS